MQRCVSDGVVCWRANSRGVAYFSILVEPLLRYCNIFREHTYTILIAAVRLTYLLCRTRKDISMS